MSYHEYITVKLSLDEQIKRGFWANQAFHKKYSIAPPVGLPLSFYTLILSFFSQWQKNKPANWRERILKIQDDSVRSKIEFF